MNTGDQRVLTIKETSPKGQYRYANVTPLVLNPGEVYVIGATLSPRDPSLVPPEGDPGADPYPNIVAGSVLVDTNINLISHSLLFRIDGGDFFAAPSEFFGFPGETIEDGYLFAPNFLFIPEPMTFFLLGLGGLSMVFSKRRKL